MRVPDAFEVGARSVNRAVDDKAGEVDARLRIGARVHNSAVQPDLEQIGRADLIKAQAELVEEEGGLGRGSIMHSEGNVVVDDLIPTARCSEAVGCGELDALRPLGLAHAGAHAVGRRGGGGVDSSTPPAARGVESA